MKDEIIQGLYRSNIKIYQTTIKKLEKEDAEIIEECRKNPATAAEKLFHLAETMLNLASNHLVINGISNSIFNIKDENSLNEARKAVFKALVYLGNVVTEKIDAAFSEYEDNLAEIAGISAGEKFALVRKIGLSIDILKNAYGENTKWKWAFVDLDGRFAVIAKNLFDLKNAVANMDPDSPGYECTTMHYETVKNLLSEAAFKYHERFNLFSKRPEDLMSAVRILDGLYKMLVVIPEREEAENVLRKISRWETEYDLEIQKHSKKPKSPPDET